MDIDKFVAICAVTILVSIFAVLGYDSHLKNQCRNNMIAAHYPAFEIQTVCK